MSFRGTVNAETVKRSLMNLQKNAPKLFAEALAAETRIEVRECKRSTPVDTGALRDGIHMEGPFQKGKEIKTIIATDPAQDDYAVIVHEDLEAHHDTGGPKYIERPLREAAPHLAARIAKRIDLKKGLT